MSTIDMMILGVLMERSINAYEMKKILEYRNVKDWAKLSSPAIYKNLLKLYKTGYVDGEVVQDGEMPEKTIYTINNKGKEYFMQLMKHCSDEPGMVYIEFATFISNLSYVDYETGVEMIENLQTNLMIKRDTISKQLSMKASVSFYAETTINLHLQMYEVFCNWIEDFKKRYLEKNKEEKK